MEDAFRELTSGISFKRKREDGKPRRPREPQQADEKPRTNDPAEAANLARKRQRIRVQGSAVPVPCETVAELGEQYKVPDSVAAALAAAGVSQPMPVQMQVWPLLCGRRDVIVISPTGSGKTLAFAVPIVLALLEQQQQPARSTGVQAVCLAPTRELAQQIARVFTALCAGSRLKATLLTKAAAAGEDFRQVDILVSTPLRLSRLLERADLSGVQHLVLDETDRLLEGKEAGFLSQVDAIMAACSNPKLVTSLFSATVPETVEQLARSIQKDPVRVTVGGRDATTAAIDHRLQFVGSEEGKPLVLEQMLQTGLRAPVLIFVNSIERAKALHRRLASQRLRVDCIFSSQDWASRQGAMERFRAGESWLLISTDVLARGIDFVGVQTVISYDCPLSRRDYIHRAGRTGRAGQSGTCITLFTEQDAELLTQIAHAVAEVGQEVPRWMLARHKAPPPASAGASQNKRGKQGVRALARVKK